MNHPPPVPYKISDAYVHGPSEASRVVDPSDIFLEMHGRLARLQMHGTHGDQPCIGMHGKGEQKRQAACHGIEEVEHALTGTSHGLRRPQSKILCSGYRAKP
jgi:hypothetical protein